MIYYAAIPIELVFENIENNYPNFQEIDYNGVKLIVEPFKFNSWKIVRIISSNPYDYMNPLYQPGNIINL
ncbi:hypothetical protein H0A61_02588 [Koleobacter methoxysyntrophicus]|uniref:YlzJ-like protein n=1 Tax=Koleobacter methoxysyntrophicus TaxID=2751313 RepID=A0A8A0RRQ2_9FIRM|nr:YlzJ-like family protein [Koleobacter methoxysyntrophicus]MDI3540703.1 hypothetical protein [Thermosediminibacterales bacterium]MDK2901160.1 hypothetical protein [Thermosediminibacterales bacterium]QSQ10189.1 hypothetical protein H0A61_02588 [Koleobacter methoxysyntrophicus]